MPHSQHLPINPKSKNPKIQLLGRGIYAPPYPPRGPGSPACWRVGVPRDPGEPQKNIVKNSIWRMLPFMFRRAAILGDLGVILGGSWGDLGRSWGHLGPSWAILGPILGDLGPSWGRLGALLASCRVRLDLAGIGRNAHCGIFVQLLPIFGPSSSISGNLLLSWADLRRSWALWGHLAPSWGRFWAILACLGAVLGLFWGPLRIAPGTFGLSRRGTKRTFRTFVHLGPIFGPSSLISGHLPRSWGVVGPS